MKKFFILGCFIALLSCDTQFDWIPTEKVYLIKSGEHETAGLFRTFSEDTLAFDAEFNSSAIYQCQNPENQADINKLLGFSNCSSFHQQNSARFGWRWYNDRLEILTYIYDNGNRSYEFITAVPLNETVHYQIIKNSEGYLFKVDDVEKQMNTSATCSGTSDYLLWPYFGGDEPAPQDIEITIEM